MLTLTSALACGYALRAPAPRMMAEVDSSKAG